MKKRRARIGFPSTVVNRGTLMFGTGLGLTIREALTKGPERPSLYVLFAGMMGMPLVWQATSRVAESRPRETDQRDDDTDRRVDR